MMPDLPHPDPALGAVLHGVRALILDADGVLVLKGRSLPGAGEALLELARRDIPYRIVTNYSSAHRETLAARFSSGGLAIDPGHIISAASAAAAYTAAAYPGRSLLVLGEPDALREWSGQRLVATAEADAEDADVAAVVVGDAGPELAFADLDAAFRVLRRGAELVAMHRNPWWITELGPTLDAGAIVAGLEYALDRRARVLGKPSAGVFRQAAAELARELGQARLPARAIAMVGDDPRSDLAPARRLGMRTVLALTGKTTREDLAAGPDAARAARFTPDGIATSIVEVVAALR
jgi:HAD superfamily hydrolase (TIGR01450 family)